MTFGQHLADIRCAKKISQEELSGRIQVSCQTIRRWEHDESLPDVIQLKALCKELQITPEHFLEYVTEKSGFLKKEETLFYSNKFASLFCKINISLLYALFFVAAIIKTYAEGPVQTGSGAVLYLNWVSTPSVIISILTLIQCVLYNVKCKFDTAPYQLSLTIIKFITAFLGYFAIEVFNWINQYPSIITILAPIVYIFIAEVVCLVIDVRICRNQRLKDDAKKVRILTVIKWCVGITLLALACVGVIFLAIYYYGGA